MDWNLDDHQPSGARPEGERVKLIGLAGLTVLAGLGLARVAGPPGPPGGLPRLDQLLGVLSGATLPLDGIGLVLLDAAWLLWAWIVVSMLLELMLAAADLVAHGAAWVGALRRLADRVSVPLVRRSVAAAFAVQVISRGVPIAAAQPLPPDHTVVVAAPTSDADSLADRPDALSSAPTATYLVRPGDTLWSIAERAYGSGTAYRRLVEANLGRQMSTGEVFSARGVIRPGWRLLAPGASWATEDSDGQRWYTVRPGDTLSSIASTVLGDPARWPELFELNREAISPDGVHTLVDPNVIWPGLRLRLPDASVQTTPAADAPEVPQPPPLTPEELMAASAVETALSDLIATAPTTGSTPPPAQEEPVPPPPPLLRTPHALDPVVLDPADGAADRRDAAPAPAAPPPAAAGATEVSVSNNSGRAEGPIVPIAAAGMGVLGAAGLVLGARRLRRLRRLPREPESEVVVEGGFAEAEPAHDLTRGLHGAGFDPLAALVGRFQQFIAEHSLASVQVVAACHGRSSTTLTLHCSLAEQPILLDLAATFAEQLEAEVEGCISADQDVVLRLVRLRKTRLLPSADAPQDAPCLVPLGVLYDRQVYSVAWPSLGHILVVSLPGHGSDTILTSLVATLTARRSPGQLRIWMIASARALPVPVFELPHLVRVVDAADPSAIGRAAEDLRAELDWRADHPAGDLLVVVPELKTLGEHAARFALLAARALELGAHFVVASSDPEEAAANPLTAQFDTRMVLRMQTEEASVALLGVADAAFLGGGGRLLLRLDGREPVELYGYQVAAEHLERLVKVMRTAYPAPVAAPAMGASQRAQAAAPPAAPQTTEHPPHLQPGASPAPTSQEPPPPSPRMNATSPVEPEVEEPCQPIIQLFCFGRPRVVCAGQQVWPRGGGDAKPWEFLLYLGCQPVDGVARSSVVEALWPEDELPDEGAHRFRQLRYRLRRQLQEVPGAPDGDGVCLGRRSLRLDPCLVYSDAQEFLTLVRSVRVNPGPDAVERLERARALYVGDLLEGPDTRRYAWVDERDGSGVTLREHFRRLFQNASVRLAELYTAAGALEPAIELYRELTDLDPADDRLWLALLRLHAQRGDRPALIAEERRLRETLRELAEEVDSASTPGADEPSREIVEEYQRLLAQLRDREPAAV